MTSHRYRKVPVVGTLCVLCAFFVRPFASFDVVLRAFDPRFPAALKGCANRRPRKCWPGRGLAGVVQRSPGGEGSVSQISNWRFEIIPTRDPTSDRSGRADG